MLSETRYARAGDLHLAYQVVGEGRFDLLFFPDWVNHIEMQWEEPRQERFLNSLASFSRLILFNPRGMGPSDPIPVTDSPTAEQWMDDALTVLDTVGSEHPALFGAGAGGTVTMLFAATYPERVRALAVVNSTARGSWAPDYPIGLPQEFLDMQRDLMAEHWGSPRHVDAMLPVLAPEDANDERLRAWLPRFQRASYSPGMAAAAQRLLFGLDIRHALSSIQAPTLVIHRAGIPAPLSVEHGRYLAAHIDGAVYKELAGYGYAFWAGDFQPILDEVEEFLTGTRSGGPPDRVLATVLFTDIVGSTATAAELGDRRWKELISEHEAIIGRELARHRGRQIHTTGDGVLATFDGPARAIRCGVAIRDALRGMNLELRAGLHTGEIELHGNDVAGIAVHIGARVSALAGPGEILVSRTVVDLVAGSGLQFEERGSHVLKGVPGEWQLFALLD